MSEIGLSNGSAAQELLCETAGEEAFLVPPGRIYRQTPNGLQVEEFWMKCGRVEHRVLQCPQEGVDLND